MKSKHILALFAYFIFIQINAQIIEDAGGITYTFYDKGEVKDNELLQNRKFTFSTWDVWLPLPPLEKGKWSVFSNINYRYLSIDYGNSEALFFNRPNNLQEMKSTIFVKYSLNSKWSLLGMAIPSLASDFKETISGNDFLMQGGFAAMKKLNSESDIEIGLGVFASYVFGEIVYLPSVIFDFESANKKWIAQAYWPRFNVFRNLKNDWQIGIAASIEGTQYNIKNYIASQGNEVDYAEYSIMQTGFQVNKKVFQSFWIQLQSGYASNNKYVLFDKNNNKMQDGDYSIDDLFYAKLILSYRM